MCWISPGAGAASAPFAEHFAGGVFQPVAAGLLSAEGIQGIVAKHQLEVAVAKFPSKTPVLGRDDRELLSLFVTPLAYVVGTLFLLLQGWNFALLLRVLNDPLAAPPGAAFRYSNCGYVVLGLIIEAVS